MVSLWWTLPGPAAFVEGICRDVRDGKNVVICLPQHAPPGLATAVRHLLQEWFWDAYPLDLADRRTPLAQLRARYVPGPASKQLVNAGALAREPSVADHLVWLDHMDDQQWPAWSAFLTDYAHACRASDRFGYCQFCLVLSGQLALHPPPSDTHLTIHRLQGVVDSLDMLLYANELLRHLSLPPVPRRIVTTVLARVSLWDPEVGDRLAAEPAPRILNPGPILCELATERGWGPHTHPMNSQARFDAIDDEAWQAGRANIMDGQAAVHVAAIMATNQDQAAKELDRHIWSAQVGVLLPLIEEYRRRILELHGSAFRMPHYPDGARRAPIVNVLDLEIGHIYHQVEVQHLGVGQDLRRLIAKLKHARDRLAHLQPLDATAVLDNDWTTSSPTSTLRHEYAVLQ